MTSKAGYWIGGGLLAFAIAGAILWGVLAFSHLTAKVDDFQRVGVPGTSTVRLQPRKYVIYLEGPGADQNVPPVDFAIVDPRTDSPLRTSRYGGSLTYSFGYAGSAVATVTPPRAASYRVRTTGADAGSMVDVALGPSIGGPLVAAIVGALAIGGLFGLGGLALLIATGVRRSRRKAAAARAQAAGTGN